MANGRGQVAKPQLATLSSVLVVGEVSKSAIVVLGRVLINDTDQCQTFSAASINSAARTAKDPKNASRCARIVAATSCGSGARAPDVSGPLAQLSNKNATRQSAPSCCRALAARKAGLPSWKLARCG